MQSQRQAGRQSESAQQTVSRINMVQTDKLDLELRVLVFSSRNPQRNGDVRHIRTVAPKHSQGDQGNVALGLIVKRQKRGVRVLNDRHVEVIGLQNRHFSRYRRLQSR